MVAVDVFMLLQNLAKCKCGIGSMCVLSPVLTKAPVIIIIFLSQGAFSDLKKAMGPLLQKAQVPFQGLPVLAEARHSQPLAEKLSHSGVTLCS